MNRTCRASIAFAVLTLALGGLSACGKDSAPGTTTPPPDTTPPPGSTTPPEPHDWPQFGWDVAHSSAPTVPTGIDASNVASMKRQQVSIDGTVDASAIYLHGAQVQGGTHDVFFVTTTYGKTIAIDANDGTILWQYTPSGYDTWAGSSEITNSTPAADPGREFIYAASPDGYIEKLAVADGHVVWRTAITKLATREKIASPLTYFQGRVIAVTGGYVGDAPPYQGHVAILDASSGNLTHVWNSLCSDRLQLLDPNDSGNNCPESRSAIWGRAGAVIDSTTGDIFVATGNGTWDGQTYWGDATIRLDSSASHMLGNYTPTNTDDLNRSDADVGSTSPVLLDGGFVAQGGKDGAIRVLDMSQLSGTTPHRGGEAQTVPTPSGSGLFTAPAVLRTSTTTWMFAAASGGTAAFTFSGGQLHAAWQNGNGGTSPVVAGGLLYVYDPHGALRVYEAETGKLVTTLECGSGHWNSPIVIDGKILLPEGSANSHSTSGVIDIWRLP